MRETSASDPLATHRNELGRHRNRGLPLAPGFSVEDTYLLTTRCPVFRRRDSHLGFRTELETLVGHAKGKGTSGGPARLKVPMGQSGADRPVVVTKRCNARGAKGVGHSRRLLGQRETGGTQLSRRKAPAFVERHEPDEARVLTSGSGAARLAAIPAGESPADTRSPVHVVVISSGGAGDQSAGSLEVKALWGREAGSIRQRGASNLAGRNVSKPGSLERRAPREADCGNFGSAEPLRSRRRPCRHRIPGR